VAQHDEKDFNFMAVMVEVAVDPESGQVRPIDALLVAETGAIVNPVAYRGQQDGGFVFGLGNALMEDLRVEDGRVSTLSLGEYKLPGPMDIPPFRVVQVTGSNGPGPFGAKSVGENVNNAVPPAVANAVLDALGTHVRVMPVTAEAVARVRRQHEGRKTGD
jgi:CO/xanthine dehydrogenase Mo-binding subunit